MKTHPTKLPFLLTLLFSLSLTTGLVAQDMPLKDVLIEGEGWEVVSEGHEFTDAPATDAQGNFYFTDVKGSDVIYKVTPDGKVSDWMKGFPRISGMMFGADGRLYACQGAQKRLIAISKAGKVETLVEDVRPNDLVTSADGSLYFTETPTKRIHMWDPKLGHKVVDEGNITRPNGISLSPCQGTLVVSDFGGTNVWAFRREVDQTLSFPQPYMTVRVDTGVTVSKGDGMTTDSAGRYYVSTEKGIQMFDVTGRISGVISKPEDKFLTNVTFSGEGLHYMYVTCADKIHRRKTQATGVIFWDKPIPYTGRR